MGLMDKVKAQATQIAERAQEAGKVGQAKIEALQAKRKADSLLEELGRITFESHTGRGAPGDEGRVADIVEQLRQYEAEFGPIGADAGADAGGVDDVPRSSDAAAGHSPSSPSGGGIPTASYGDGEV